MRYFDGSLRFVSVDVTASAHGRTWQHTRSFSNSLGTHAPAFNPNSAMRLAAKERKERRDTELELRHGLPGIHPLTQTIVTVPPGTQTSVSSSVKFHYNWIEIPQAGFRLANVSLEIDHLTVAAAYYEYHLSGSPQGRAGDLRRVQRARLSPIAGGGIENVGDSWYTYHLTDFRGLKFALEQEALARVRAANIDPASPVAGFTGYADFHFEYDASGRVQSETVKAGAYTYTFDYFQRGAVAGGSSSSSIGPVNPYPTEFNTWRYCTIETRPGGTKNIVYCNASGQTMLHVFRSGTNKWLTGYRFGEKGRVIRKAESSAILPNY